MTQWRRMFRRLSETPELAPSEGFANRVMARVPTQQPAVAPSRVRSLAARVATLLPRRRERLAAVSGVAVGPTAVLGALAYMVFSNPLTTPSTVLSYVWAKAMAALSLTTQALLGGALESAALRTAYGFFEVFTGSGALVAGSLIAFAGMTMVAGWVLYRYLIKIPSMDQRYASI